VEVFGATSQAGFIQKARRIEELGYATLLAGDHFFTFGPVAGMIAAANATHTLRVGSYVLGNDFYHPAVLAREAATVDLLTNGRLELGLGTGYLAMDYSQTGIRLDSPGVRLSRLEESVNIVKRLLSGEKVTFSGQYYSVSDLEMSKPVQQPHPPLLIGGGSKRILSLAAREADIVGFNIRTTPEGGFDPGSVSPEATRQKLEWILAAAGERASQLEFNLLSALSTVTDRPHQKAEEFIAGWKQFGVEFTFEQVMESPHVLLGSVDQIVDKLERNREEYGISYIAIFEDALENFAPVVERLAGS
jgi:probable F420-dependent oxidoreductase